MEGGEKGEIGDRIARDIFLMWESNVERLLPHTPAVTARRRDRGNIRENMGYVELL